jgi:integrase
VAQQRRPFSAQSGLKSGTNTEQQKRATFALFGGYWRNRSLRDVTRADAARFMDSVRLLDPAWARSPRRRTMAWDELQRRYAGRERGLSDATMNRHSATLQSLWEWAAERYGYEGRNPFGGFRRRLKQGVNVNGYVAWEPNELKRLLEPPPTRADLTELIVAGMFTGMRLDELASLRGDQVRQEDDVTFIQVEDSKTPAGNRQVPLHPRLSWLAKRAEKVGSSRIWPGFNLEGPGRRAGADAGREFSRFKQGRGFASRRKAFHSFRKNVTRIMERAGVPENEWAQVFGHERGFTYGRYNPDGITLRRKAEIIRLIDYAGVPLPSAS